MEPVIKEISAERTGKSPVRPLPSAADIRAQVERILEGTSFCASPRRRAMLRFIVEETLAGRGSRLKGVTVAQSVFGRDETFDQQSDPVVRLEARRLRSDLDSYYVDAGSQDPVRVTVPKGGYVPHFAWQDHDAPLEPVDATATPQAPTEAGTPVKRRRRRLTLVAALFVVGALLALGTTFIGRPGANSNATADRKPAIIVLPFEAFGDIDDIGLIASGVTEELIANLMMFKDFRVYSTTTSFRQDADADPETVGRDLGVSFVVTGVMQSQNGQVYLRARLVDTQTGEVRWSGSYEEPLDAGDLFVAQKDLAVAISTELGEPYGAVNDAIGQRMANNSTPSMPSYTCILRAYDYRRTFSEALFVPAMACLKQAVIRDPNYADAWAMLGWLQLDSVRRSFAPETEHPARMAAAFEAASHAVELEPRSPRALAALSAVTFYQGDYVTAEALQREVLALNPNDPDTLAQLGWRLAVRGNREGLTYLEQAVTRSANPPGWYHNLRAVYAYLDGDYLRALAEAKKSATSGSAVGMSFVAMSHAKLGDMDAARDALAAMTEGWPLLGRDPAAAYRLHHTDETIVAVLVEGLLSAGWAPPSADYQ